MKIIKKAIKELEFANYNPRKISGFMLEKLANSINRFGYIEPIIWNSRTKNVVGGNQRLRILKERLSPDDMIDVVEVDFDIEKEKALNLALNKITGDWDEIKLQEIIIKMSKEDIELSGFNDLEIKNFLRKNDIEIREFDENITTLNRCPKCGYEW